MALSFKKLATIDLGSNSFHMLIVSVDANQKFKIVRRQKQKVQLRAGMSRTGVLSQEVMERALLCFERFARQLERHQVDHVDVVGTYTLRKAIGLDDFLQESERRLGHPIRIVSGEEEARLIYVGASRSSDLPDKHLIIDIGGGSTELIVGENGNIESLHSLEMGCVSIQQQFFGDGVLAEERFDGAIEFAQSLILPIRDAFHSKQWSHCLGTSGTVQAVWSILRLFPGFGGGVGLNDLKHIQNQLIQFGRVREVAFVGLRADRENILPGGLSVLIALFEVLDITEMRLSSGAVREGVLHELIQRYCS